MDPDLELLDRWIAGDQAAGNALFQRHFDEVFLFLQNKVGDDAEELAQDTFLACVRRRDGFRRQSSFRTFVFAIARFELYAYWRRRDRRGAALDFNETSFGELITTPGTRMDRATDHARLLHALRSLPLEVQLLLELHYWVGLTGDQLAEVFEIAPVTARTRLFRARQLLRARLDDADAAPARDDGGFDRWVSSLRAKRPDLPRDDAPPPTDASAEG